MPSMNCPQLSPRHMTTLPPSSWPPFTAPALLLAPCHRPCPPCSCRPTVGVSQVSSHRRLLPDRRPGCGPAQPPAVTRPAGREGRWGQEMLSTLMKFLVRDMHCTLMCTLNVVHGTLHTANVMCKLHTANVTLNPDLKHTAYSILNTPYSTAN